MARGPGMRLPTVMKGGHAFSKVPKATIERSTFDRSHGYKTTFDAGYLIPFYADEALPGDTFSLNASVFARLSTQFKPIMDNLYMDTFFFAVPIRLIWANWQKFNGEQANPGDSTSFACPIITTTPAIGSLSDYLGLPCAPKVTAPINFVSFWHRAYNLIWNQWFRDQNLQTSAVVDTDDGPDSIADYVLRRRGKRHDYFTSCLPWPQKGTAVSLPLSGLAEVRGIAVGTTVDPIDGNPPASLQSGGVGPSGWAGYHQTSNAGTYLRMSQATAGGPPIIQADLGTVVNAITINQLRQSFQIQKLLERDARGGTRYTEIIKAHFGVTSPDARLQRAEYLGGGSSPVSVSAMTQTAPQQAAGVTTPQGNLAGVAIAAFSGHGFTKSFTEHCVLLGLVSVRADLTYQQGMDRMFSRSTRYDFYWPAFSHIGEQAVLRQEIYCVGEGADFNAFGYQERHAEYRYKPSKITGKFRSDDPTTLHVWHLSQNFATAPTLGDTFIQETPPMARIKAVSTEPDFMFDSYIRLICARPMPVFGVPGMIDHF